MDSTTVRFSVFLQNFARIVAVATLGIGLLVLLGWALSIEAFTSVLPGLATMKVNTAICLMLGGTSLWFLLSTYPPGRRIAQICALLMALITLTTLGEYIFGWNLGIDQLFVRDELSAGSSYPGRTSFMAAFSLAALAFALLLMDARQEYPTQLLAHFAAAIALMAFSGYLYGVEELYTIGFYSATPLHSSVSIFVLAVGILCARPARGVMTLITSAGTAGYIVRRLLPVTVIVPLAVGGLILGGYQVEAYPLTFGFTLFTLSMVIAMSLSVLWNVHALHALGADREKMIIALQASQEHLEERVQERTVELAEAHIQLREQLEEQEAAEARFRGLLESAPDAIVVDDDAGQIVVVNSQVEELFGYPRAEILDKPIEFLLPEEHSHLYRAHRDTLLTAERTQLVGAKEALSGRRRDGSEFPVQISLSRLETRNGPLVMSAIRDITELQEAERELQQLAYELARSNTDLEQFAYVASHDLQEPLRMVSSYLQLLERRYKGKLDSDADEFISYAVDGANRMQTLIRDLLAYSRVGTRGQPSAAANCEKALQKALSNLSVSVTEAGGQITHDALPVVFGDEGQLVQLFQNLVGNAIKFRGSVSPIIHVGVEPGKDEWRFSVRDNGIGIDAKYAERIFVIFQRLHTRDEHPGTGIGLALCKKIVERHGGRIWLESELGHGATIFFTLPEPLKPNHRKAQTNSSQVSKDRVTPIK